MIPFLSPAGVSGISTREFVDFDGGNEPSKVDKSGMLRLFPI